MRWLQRIVNDHKDLGLILDAITYFQTEHANGRRVLDVKGTKIELKLTRIGSEIDYFYAMYQEVEMILKHCEEIVEREIVDQTQLYMDTYNRKISEQTARKYAEVHDDVQTKKMIKAQVALVRNDFLALFKGLETLSFKLKDNVELRKAMLDDAVFV